MIVACIGNAEVFDGLDLHKFVFPWLISFADTAELLVCGGLLSILLPFPIFDLEMTRFDTFTLLLLSYLRGHTKGECR